MRKKIQKDSQSSNDFDVLSKEDFGFISKRFRDSTKLFQLTFATRNPELNKLTTNNYFNSLTALLCNQPMVSSVSCTFFQLVWDCKMYTFVPSCNSIIDLEFGFPSFRNMVFSSKIIAVLFNSK